LNLQSAWYLAAGVVIKKYCYTKILLNSKLKMLLLHQLLHFPSWIKLPQIILCLHSLQIFPLILIIAQNMHYILLRVTFL